MSTEGNNIALFFITEKGRLLAQKLAGLYPDMKITKYSAASVAKKWQEHRGFIFIMAAGIVVRTVAPLLKDKKTDPAVVVLDEAGRFAISLLSGHIGGANELASEIAGFLGAEAVITTASDVNGLVSIDLWAQKKGLVIEDWEMLPHAGRRFIDSGSLKVYDETGIDLPPGFTKTDGPADADLLITNKNLPSVKGGLYLRPKNLVIGIGCNSGTSEKEIELAVKRVLKENDLSFNSVSLIATIDLKAEEPGLRKFCAEYSFDLITFSPNELNSVNGVAESAAAFKATGAKAVAEPAALLGAGSDRLLAKKRKSGNVTIAVAEINKGVNAVEKGKPDKTGKIYVVGTGPGDISHITPYAQRVIKDSDVVVGYGTYIELIKDLLKGKEVFSTGMTQEIDRCRKAVELASGGRTVSVISGGDPGIYAMAGLVFELLRQQGESAPIPSVEIVPGISALNACASRLGAPLMHDFASISLSDRLTSWEVIEKRLEAASMADFVIVLYNPKSKGRTEQIGKARDIVMKHRGPDTPVGIVRGAMRENESIVVTDLRHMLDAEIDMQSSVVIGNSNTFIWNNLMITPRGYEKKKQFSK